MMTNLAPPQIRAITGLELAAGVFTKCSDRLASQLHISLTSGKRDSGPTPFRIGINGDVYGAARAHRSRHAAGRYRLRESVGAGGHGLSRQRLLQKEDAAESARLFSIMGSHRAGGVKRSWHQIAEGCRAEKNSASRVHPHVGREQRHLFHDFDYSIFVRIVVRQNQTLGRQSSGVRPAVLSGALKSIAKRSISAVFDEGISTPGSWLYQALYGGYEIIPIEPAIIRKLEQMGYTRSTLPKSRYPQLKEDVLTIDYSGWALVTHR